VADDESLPKDSVGYPNSSSANSFAVVAPTFPGPDETIHQSTVQ
jgi:hypothetical protein